MASRSVQPFRGTFVLPNLDETSVADVMRPGVVACPPETPLREVARMMATQRIHCVVVSGIEQAGGHLAWRVISDLDVVHAVAENRRDATAGDAASEPVVTCAPGDRVVDAARRMAERGSTHLVVASEERRAAVGVLSTLDVAEALASSADGAQAAVATAKP